MSQTSSSSNNMTGGPQDFGVYQDIELTCCEPGCDCKWEFTAGEQDWYTNKGFEFPKRCHACKALKKLNQGSRPQTQRPSYNDITITCRDCNHDFQWLARDQAFFAKQQPPFPPPGRCRSCKGDRNQRFRQHQDS